jgi:hypothetical protein
MTLVSGREVDYFWLYKKGEKLTTILNVLFMNFDIHVTRAALRRNVVVNII